MEGVKEAFSLTEIERKHQGIFMYGSELDMSDLLLGYNTVEQGFSTS